METADAVNVASELINVAKVSPEDIVVFPYVTLSKVTSVSASVNCETLNAESDVIYFTYNV